MKKMSKTQTSKVKKTILSVAIAILFVMFIAYAIETFYDSPEIEDFCGEFKTTEIIETAQRCEQIGGQWNVYEGPVKPETGVSGWCDRDFTCGNDFEEVWDVYNRNIFFVALGIGILTIIVSVFLSLEVVAGGFMAGGVLLVIYGTLRYWGSLSDVWRTIMLGLSLVVLVWVGYKKLNS